jgi:hypothetical protein
MHSNLTYGLQALYLLAAAQIGATAMANSIAKADVVSLRADSKDNKTGEMFLKRHTAGLALRVHAARGLY